MWAGHSVVQSRTTLDIPEDPAVNAPAKPVEPVVLIAEELSPATIEALGPDFEIRHCDGADRAALLPALSDVDAVLIRSATRIDAEALAAGNRLSVVARAGIGLDNVDVPAATARGVLAAFLSADRSDMLLWFRPEEPQTVSWGGSVRRGADGRRAAPSRLSERWVEAWRDRARPWIGWELEIAESLRHGVTEVVVRGLRRASGLHDKLRQS